MNIYSLDRFVEAQEQTYSVALREIMAGKKTSHWMWYIFPQLRGLGRSAMAHAYGISGIEEAKRYLSHPVLSARIVKICKVLLLHADKRAEEIFGGIDALKLRSSMTLFALVNDDNSIFHEVLNVFYNGQMDERTIGLMDKM